MNSWARNAIPIELPGTGVLQEALRRSLPSDRVGDMYVLTKYYLQLYGYSDLIINMLIESPETYNIIVKDRFGQDRVVPLSLVYELPSASDVARMMVRDIFATPEDFFKLYKARGMVEDIGALYYFLRFRYPPPERLWQFTMRGVSGLLWATLPDEEKREIEEELQAFKAPMPKAPVDLNFDPEKLLSAFKTYMKWHDYFRGAWIENFTSDNLLYIDTLADIPTKIDQRWMTRYGIYELLSIKGVTHESPIQDFVDKVIENSAQSVVQLDVRNFCRTLQATGLHPYWVPVTAVAETITAITDERTLLRTGAVSLFKEGFWNADAVEAMLAGAIVTSFHVAYFDIRTMMWQEGWINIPLMYLPPERKLIELRALMDRALDVLREIQRDVSRAYQEYIIWDYNEYKSKLSAVIQSIDQVFASDYEKLTGVKLPDELHLKFVENYYKPYVEALRIWRDVYTIRRMRSWSARWLGWIMYRLAYGAVTPEDVDKLIRIVEKKTKLTSAETDLIREVMAVLYGMAQREYSPTPSQLATIAEYVVVPEDVINSVFEARKIPEEWAKIWKDYINVRPIADDVKSMLTSYRRALIYTTVPDDIKKKVEEYASLINFTDREWDVLALRVRLEELILQSREYIPTPAQLATFSEYMVLPDELIAKVFNARNVPEEWRDVWLKYISVRPLKPDAKTLLSAYVRAYRYAVVTEEEFKKFLEELPQYGFTDKEISLIRRRAELEALIETTREQRREYIPTPSMLVSFAEYVVLTEDLINSVFEARHVPEEWQTVWKTLVDVRPIADDVRGLITSYRRALLYTEVPEEIEKKVKDYAKLINFTDREWDILALRVQLEELILQARENRAVYIPTPSQLATIVEYVPGARQFFDEVMQARHVPKEWIPIWSDYVDIRPIASEVRKMYSRIEDLYVYFMIDDKTYMKALEELKVFGYTDREIQLMFQSSDYERQRRAYSEICGSISRMMTLAEYSPKARDYALGLVYKMIDALNLPEEEKQELRQMWEQYIRIRPVYEEVQRYVTELINDFVEGIITQDQFVSELEVFKD